MTGNGTRDHATHNRAQVRYFERAGREAMKPVDSQYVRRQVDELIRFSGLARGAHVLEVGCGMGRYTLPLARRGLRLEGIDLSQSLLDRLESHNADRLPLELHCLDVVEAPERLGRRYDAVVGFFILHHLHDLDVSFDAIARLVRPGGNVTFLEPNPLNPMYYAQLALSPGMSWDGERGIMKMRSSIVGAAMHAAGLVGFRRHRFGFLPPFAANLRFAPPLERALERFPLWRPLLPFQLFGAQGRIEG
jgi:2-polyprenyl-3-methyl-5-hydroxy-6-metoxy-1,4-benzoquinol methylase